MMHSRLVRMAVTGLLLATSLASAQSSATPPKISLEEDFKFLAAVFEPPGVPSIKGKPWKIADVGPTNWKRTVEGWLLEETSSELVLRNWAGDVERLKEPVDATRPMLKENPDGSINGIEFENVDYSTAWNVKAADYLVKSKEFLVAGLPKKKDDDKNSLGFRSEFDLIHHILESAHYAHYANQLGEHELAAALHALSQRGYAEYGKGYIVGMPPDESWQKFIAEQTARGLRNFVVQRGHRGLARKEMHRDWVRIAAIPKHSYRDEASDMVEQYARMIKEDEVWKEPDRDTLGKMTTEAKVEYWLYHLRDLDIGQNENPGRCQILGGHFLDLQEGAEDRANAAEELKKLGVAAVPALIAHLGDTRPTRCKEHWRSYWPDGHHLLRYGDCCQQILDGITEGHMFGYESRRSYPIAADAQQKAKDKFAAWLRKSKSAND